MPCTSTCSVCTFRAQAELQSVWGALSPKDAPPAKAMSQWCVFMTDVRIYNQGADWDFFVSLIFSHV